MQEFKVGQTAVGKRADLFIADKFPQYTRSALRSLFDGRGVVVNQRLVKPSFRLKAGDKVSVDVAILASEPEAIDLPVLYEDKDVVVINKPAGILTHSKGALNLEPSVASFIKNKLSDKKLTGNRAGIVHRLDRSTSGIIIAARNQQALNYLQKRFSNRQAKKTYLAVVEGTPVPKAAIIDVPVGRNPRKPQSFTVTASGKPAQTEYKVLKSFKKGTKDYSLVELKPLTGRTHQIRLHMAYIGYPVAGDPVYGSGDGQLLLHSQKLELQLPSGRKKAFLALPPREFNNFLQNE